MRNHWLVTYDIADERRLVRVQRLCERFGTALQRSVFLCEINERALASLQTQMLMRIKVGEDTVTYYPVCERDLLQGLQIEVCEMDDAQSIDHWVV
jgi:CRISPR-associated protein Cas2